METATALRAVRAARTSDKCPSCSAPIVGTNASGLPSRRTLREAALISSIVEKIFKV